MSSATPPTDSSFLPPWLQLRLEGYARIGQVMWLAASYYVHDLWTALRQGHLSVLFGARNDAVHDQAFARFYEAVSHDFTKYESTTAVPDLVSAVHGVVIDLGPGSGNQLARFDPRRIAHVYGVEPNTAFANEAFAERLRRTDIGAEGKYTLVPCGIEDAAEVLERRYGVREGEVDCVLSMQVMCSLPDLEEQVRRMHRLLKPGGELIFWEHCRNPDAVTGAVQWLCSFLWKRVIGGCRLDHVTRDAIVNAAEWEVVDVHMECQPDMMMPRVWGRLAKPKMA